MDELDDEAFLDEVGRLLPGLVVDFVEIEGLRVVDDRAWPRVAVDFRVVEDVLQRWRGRTVGVVHEPFGADWRWLNAVERPQEYAELLASAVNGEVHQLDRPLERPEDPTPQQVRERWPWLLERLRLLGEVVEVGPGRLHVTQLFDDDETGEYTVLVTPEQWARFGEPLDPTSDDPQDFNPLGEATFLVCYEDELVWSIREELPPVRWGAELRRAAREARERGDDMSGWGWYAYRPLSEPPDDVSS